MKLIWLLLAVLCLVYGIFIRAIGSGTMFFVVWLVAAGCFAGFAAAAHFSWWSLVPKPVKKILLILVGIGILVFVVTEGFILSGFREESKDDLDYLIVLGAQVHKNGPSAVLQFRLDRAITYLNENPDTLCIVTGGQGYNEPWPEAEGMAAYLVEKGIDEKRILVENRSTTTAENIQNSMAFIEEGASVGIVTNDFHMFRALQIARKQGLEATGVVAGSVKINLPNNLLREFFGEIKYWLVQGGR